MVDDEEILEINYKNPIKKNKWIELSLFEEINRINDRYTKRIISYATKIIEISTGDLQ